jgi:hypothetical protein
MPFALFVGRRPSGIKLLIERARECKSISLSFYFIDDVIDSDSLSNPFVFTHVVVFYSGIFARVVLCWFE